MGQMGTRKGTQTTLLCSHSSWSSGPTPQEPRGEKPTAEGQEGTQGGLPFLAMRMQFSRVSWRQRWGSQHHQNPDLTLPRGILGQLVLGLVRAQPVLTVTRDTPPGRKA